MLYDQNTFFREDFTQTATKNVGKGVRISIIVIYLIPSILVKDFFENALIYCVQPKSWWKKKGKKKGTFYFVDASLLSVLVVIFPGMDASGLHRPWGLPWAPPLSQKFNAIVEK